MRVVGCLFCPVAGTRAALELRIRHFALLPCPLLRRPWPTSCRSRDRSRSRGLSLGLWAGQRHGMRGVCVVPGKQPQNGRLGARDTLAWHHHKQVFCFFRTPKLAHTIRPPTYRHNHDRAGTCSRGHGEPGPAASAAQDGPGLCRPPRYVLI